MKQIIIENRTNVLDEQEACEVIAEVFAWGIRYEREHYFRIKNKRIKVSVYRNKNNNTFTIHE